MSCRQPTVAARAMVATAANLSLTCVFWVLMIHLHHGDCMKPLEESPGADGRELRISRLEAQKELVRRRAIAEVRRVKERVIELRKSIQSDHSEAGGQARKEDRPFVGRNDECWPGEQRAARD